MRTPITYYGGKQQLASVICDLIPDHTTYCEPFFGGGAVFFQKPKSEVEIINDLNREVINFYEQVKINFDNLEKRVQATPHSRELYRDAMTIYENTHLFNQVDRAWAFYVLTNQGYSGQIGTWGFGTSGPSVERKLDNRRKPFTTDLRDRLDRTQIECHDALYLIKIRDRIETFFYLDPPYFNSDMGHYGGYTKEDFSNLLTSCAKMQGKFLLSSYPSDLLTEYTQANGWWQIEIEKHTAASSKRKIKTEVLTANYPIRQAATRLAA